MHLRPPYLYEDSLTQRGEWHVDVAIDVDVDVQLGCLIPEKTWGDPLRSASSLHMSKPSLKLGSTIAQLQYNIMASTITKLIDAFSR